ARFIMQQQELVNQPADVEQRPMEETPQQAARELTQTDHLNRRLLKSLLDNMQATVGVTPGEENGANEESNNEFEE
ncbi:hypothetical protein KR009_009083, partial [Drosophila setifemur]